MSGPTPKLCKTLRVIVTLCQVGNKLGAIPYTWDKKKKMLVKVGRIQLIGWYIGRIYCCCNELFMIVRFIQASCCMDISYGTLFANLISLSTIMGASWLHINAFFRLDEIPLLMNHIVKVNQILSENEGGGKVKDWDSKSLARKILFFSYMFSCTQFFAVLKVAKTNPRYWFTLLPNAQQIPNWMVVPFAIFECLFSFHGATVCIFSVIMGLAYSRVSSRCLELLQDEKDEIKARLMFRLLQIINTEYNYAFGRIAVPSIIVGALMANICSTYATLKLFDEVPMPAYLAFPAMYIASSLIGVSYLSTAGAVLEKSEELIGKMKKEMMGKTKSAQVQRAFVKSCKPLKVWVSRFDTVEHSSALWYFRVSIDNTVTLLLSF